MAEFFAMGGYGFYVWSSYGVVALCLIGEVVWVRRRQRTIVSRVGRIIPMNKRQQHET